MKTAPLLLLAAVMSVSAFSQTSAPTAPSLTVGAQFKGLRFDWNKVPGATWYQLEYRAHQTGDFVQQGDDFPATATSTRFSFPLHLYDWTYARYRLAACNSAGCSRSAAVSVSDLRRDAVGYFKSSQPAYGAGFGQSADLAPDGYSFVAYANESITTSTYYNDGGAAYVFRRGSDGKWGVRARLLLDNHEDIRSPGSVHVATSGTGNTVAVGMSGYTGPDISGAVDVYYSQTGAYARKRISRPGISSFGTSVGLSESGYILAVGTDDSNISVAIYKSVNGVWQSVRDLPVSWAGTGERCNWAHLTRDGKSVVEQCVQGTGTQPRRSYIRVHSGNNFSVRTDIDLWTSPTGKMLYTHQGLAVDRTGDTVAVQFSSSAATGTPDAGEVRVYKRGANGYSRVATLTPGAWRASAFKYVYGNALALSGDGQTLAVGDHEDNGTGLGPRAAPLVSGADTTGAVYVYRLVGTWKLANMVKPNYPPPALHGDWFGTGVALSQTGKTLIAPTYGESSSASGIDGDWANWDLPSSGAIFMY